MTTETAAVLGETQMHAFATSIAGAVVNDDDDNEASHCTDECAQIEQQLGATNSHGESLYDYLVRKNEALVAVDEVEREFSTQFVVEGDPCVNDDMHYVRLMNEEIKASFTDFVMRLDLTAGSIAGLHESQTNGDAFEQAQTARHHAVCVMAPILTKQGGSQEELLAQAMHLRDVFTKKSINVHRTLLQTSMNGITGLGRICAAFQFDNDISEVIQREQANVCDVCVNPPRCFCDQLALNNVSISVIAGCLGRSNTLQPSVGASTLQPSFGKIVSMLAEYLSNPLVNSGIRNACVASINMLRAQKNTADDSLMWSSAYICDLNHAKAVSETLTPDHVLSLSGPRHMQSNTGLWVAARASNGQSLRVVRFFSLLVDCVRHKVLMPRCVKADIMLSSVARERGDKLFAASRLGGVFSLQVPKATPPPQVAAAQRTDSAVPMRGLHFNFQNAYDTVPLYLERDFHIASAMLHFVSSESTVMLRNIVESMMKEGGYYNGSGSTLAGVRQEVRGVVGKAIEYAAKDWCSDGVMQLTQAASGDRGGGTSMTFDAVGAQTMRAYLVRIIEGMGKGIEPWPMSRSSKSRKKSSATSRHLHTDKQAKGKSPTPKLRQRDA